MLPEPLRYVGPYREAQARLANRSVGFMTRRSNRFWIGQSRMPWLLNLRAPFLNLKSRFTRISIELTLSF